MEPTSRSFPSAKARDAADLLSVATASFSNLQIPLSADPCLKREAIIFARPPHPLLERLRKHPLVLWRQIATPTHETCRFFGLAKEIGRPPLIVTIPNDRFTPAQNLWKRRIGKLAVETRSGHQGVRIISFQESDGRRFSDIRCIDGTPFVQFHSRLLAAVQGRSAPCSVLDGEPWQYDGNSLSRYERFFALLTCFGGLAETYLDVEPEKSFVERVVMPAFERTQARFGRPPSIVPLLPAGRELDAHWDRYPALVLPEALRAAGRPAAASKAEAWT